jgi:hypothetical protein
MDEFLRIGSQEKEEKKRQKEKRKNSIDKKRVARLKKSFLPYWAREMEYTSKQEQNINLSH